MYKKYNNFDVNNLFKYTSPLDSITHDIDAATYSKIENGKYMRAEVLYVGWLCSLHTTGTNHQFMACRPS